MYGGISAADYKKKLGDLLGEEARNMWRLETKEARKLILDNMPQEEELEWKLEEDKREMVEKIGNDRRVDALKSRGKIVQKETKKGETENGSKKRKKRDRREYIFNIQTEAGPLKDQYEAGGREDMEEEGEQPEADEDDDTSLSEGLYARGDAAENDATQETKENSDQKNRGTKKIKLKRNENRLMNFGPYHRNAYGEALRSNPDYAKYLIKENKRDNQKARFTHWAMAFIMETFF